MSIYYNALKIFLIISFFIFIAIVIGKYSNIVTAKTWGVGIKVKIGVKARVKAQVKVKVGFKVEKLLQKISGRSIFEKDLIMTIFAKANYKI